MPSHVCEAKSKTTYTMQNPSVYKLYTPYIAFVLWRKVLSAVFANIFVIHYFKSYSVNICCQVCLT